MSLADIGRKNFTEKANLGFLDIYEEHWEYLDREAPIEPITFLEIGVYNGNSIKTWLDYFPLATIIGIDKYHNPYVHDISKAVILKGDQADTNFLARVASDHGPFDIIIDDGGHHWDEQQISFEYLWPHVKPGGMYIIEDLQTSDDPYWAGESIEPTSDELAFIANTIMKDTYRGKIASIHIYPRLCIIKKEK